MIITICIIPVGGLIVAVHLPLRKIFHELRILWINQCQDFFLEALDAAQQEVQWLNFTVSDFLWLHKAFYLPN